MLEIGGEKFRALEPAAWDAEVRLEAMERMRISRQVVSPMPELLSYRLSIDDALALGGFVNDEMEALCERARGRLLGLGTVPLQDPARAAAELERLMQRAFFCGVEIGTHVCGTPVGDARFNEFFATAEQLGAAVFVHALHPIGDERLIGPAVLRATVGYPCELALSISSLITGGMLTRHPRLRVCFSHGGGAFGLVLPRLQHVWSAHSGLHESITEAPRTQAARLYYDDLVYDAETLKHLIRTFGERQLAIGTDYPFLIHDANPVGSLEALGLDARQAQLLLHQNAERFLGPLSQREMVDERVPVH